MADAPVDRAAGGPILAGTVREVSLMDCAAVPPALIEEEPASCDDDEAAAEGRGGIRGIIPLSLKKSTGTAVSPAHHSRHAHRCRHTQVTDATRGQYTSDCLIPRIPS